MLNINNNIKNTIYSSICIALILSVIPMPKFLDIWRPNWTIMCLSYWLFYQPKYCGLRVNFLTGLATDLLIGSTVGIRTLIYSIIWYICIPNHKCLKHTSILQQALFIGLIVFVDKILVLGLEFILFDAKLYSGYFYSVFSSMILWSWIVLILKTVSDKFQP